VEGERARRLTLIDPETGAVLPRGRTWLLAGLVIFGTSFMALVVMALAPVLPEVAAHFGKQYDGKLAAQLLQVMPSIGVMVGAPGAGWLVERTGARRFLLIAFTIFGLAGSAGLTLDAMWALLASRFILGAAASGIVTATLFMIGEYFDAEARARILGYQSAVGAAGALAIGLAAGQLAHLGGWRAPFGLYLVAFPMALLVFFAIPAGRPGGRPRPKTGPGKSEQRGSILRLLPLLVLIVVVFVGSYMPNIQTPFLLDDDGVSDPFLRSLVVSVGALTVSAGSACYGLVQVRLGDRWTMRLCCALLAMGIIAMGLAPSGEWVALGCVIAGLGTGIANPQVNNMLINAADPSVRGRALGLGYTARYLGNFLNPIMVHPLAVAFGIHTAFVAVGGILAVGVLLSTAQRRRAVA
jgi:MFS family permease